MHLEAVARAARVLSIGLIVAVSCSGTARADGFRNPPPGGEGLGRSGAFAAQVEGPLSVHFNPANLGDAKKGVETEVSLALAHTKTTWEGAGRSFDSEDPWQVLPNLFASWKAADGVGVGLGLTTPYGQSVEWDGQSPFRYAAPYWAQMTMININPSVGWRVNDQIAIGAGLDVAMSSLRFKQIFPWGVVVKAPVPDGEIEVDTSGTAVGANAGLTLTPAAGHRVALTYRSAMTVDYEGDMTPHGAPPLPGLAKGDFETELAFPDIVTLGYGVEITKAFRVEADVEWLGWSCMDAQPLDAGANNALLAGRAVPYLWEDTWTFNVGADWAFTPEWTARAGYSFLESPVPEMTYSPILPDADRHVITVGLGWHNERNAVDAAWAFSIYDDRTIAANLVPGYNGSYEMASDLLTLSYRRSF